jgi:hypothetical protein
MVDALTPELHSSQDICESEDTPMGGVHKAQPNNNAANTSISIAISLATGLGNGANNVAQAFAGPNGAQAFAGQQPGGFGSINGAGCGPNQNAMANNFGGPGGPQNAFQQGFQQGQQASRKKKLLKKIRKLMAKLGQMGGGPPGFGGPSPFGQNAAFAGAGPQGAFATAGIPGGNGFARLF